MPHPTIRERRRHFRVLIAALALMGAGSPATAGQGVAGSVVGGIPQAPPAEIQPPRDRVPPRRVGTGVIRGRVVDGVSGQPILRARVRLMGSGPMSGPAPPQQAQTDGEGSFEFRALPPGNYSLMVEKSTYVTGRFPDPGRFVRARSQPIAVSDGAVVEGVSVAMFRGGVITGRVVDSYGDPLDGAMVRILRVPRGGRPTSAGQAQSNDLGEYRLPRLQPGRYLLSVRPQMTSNVQFDPSVVEAPLPQPMPTYYPNVTSMAQAQPIIVNRGETMSGIDVMLGEGVPSVINGVVVRSDGEAVQAGSVSMRAVGPDSTGGFDSAGAGPIRQGGAFRLNAGPGEYVIEANVPRRVGMQMGPMGPDSQLFGSARVNVGGAGVENVTIVVGTGATATGRVIFEGGTPPPSPGQVRVPLVNPDGPGCRGGTATIAQDWSFKAEDLNGTCGAPQGGMFGRWTIKAVMFRGQNILDQVVPFESGQQYSNIQIIVTDKRTQVDVRVTGDDGQPTREYVALAFSTDKAKWGSGPMRQVRTLVPTPRGTADSSRSMLMPAPPGMPPNVAMGMSMGMGVEERFVGLLPGEYFIVAIDDIEAEDLQDPGVLEKLAVNATRVTVSDEAPLEVPLRRLTLNDVVR